jgi:cation:H+ antiporter
VLPDLIDSLSLTHPATYCVIFLVASLVMLWRLEAMLDHGLEGTALGTLITPYCSGLGNLLFVFILVQRGGPSADVLTNCLVNNVTNLTLLLGAPALLWGLQVIPRAGKSGGKSGGKARPKKGGGAAATGAQINRLSLLLTLAAVLFFTGATWLMTQDGKLGRTDGFLLMGLFLFWQSFQVFDVLKHNLRRKISFDWRFYADAAVVLACAWALYESIDWLVAWISAQKGGFISAEHLGWLSGWLMVVPNALLAFYWGWKRRADIVYTSQVGDGHISIPLCLGLYAVLLPATVPAAFNTGLLLLLGAGLVHMFCLLLFGGLPRWAGAVLVAAYGWFVWNGLLA